MTMSTMACSSTERRRRDEEAPQSNSLADDHTDNWERRCHTCPLIHRTHLRRRTQRHRPARAFSSSSFSVQAALECFLSAVFGLAKSRDLRLVLIGLCALAHLIPTAQALRCYTDVAAHKGNSVECGLNTGCVKIYIDSEEMRMKLQREQGAGYGYGYGYGKEPPPLAKKYQGNPVLMRGCFVLAVPDRCYNAKNGVSYCWCSTKDLCNAAAKSAPAAGLLSLVAVSLATAMAASWMRRS